MFETIFGETSVQGDGLVAFCDRPRYILSQRAPNFVITVDACRSLRRLHISRWNLTLSGDGFDVVIPLALHFGRVILCRNDHQVEGITAITPPHTHADTAIQIIPNSMNHWESYPENDFACSAGRTSVIRGRNTSLAVL